MKTSGESHFSQIIIDEGSRMVRMDQFDDAAEDSSFKLYQGRDAAIAII